mmetsp:Transcript_23339/g.48487  ORF Transcript_23339/g.48487 Transcript_23339/m.48487 type:complete len:211 (-) Transcript_23339:116-748(-)|eukprot:CAMPEP_0172450384 /NCGR_PEP_ID=MMETSP1065-20121228/8744_1 /TAXON_ID=265537 /ORGANISM="Amphiprora paludosa, Strain CCMP125" /LENGTH=210 /DNA_ID=CAMNT_0013202163 /DNA_START=122 /DNA_END=754 /DNA_ORIENTATION=-
MPPNRKSNVLLEDIPEIDVNQLKLAVVPSTSTTAVAAPKAPASYWDWDTPTNDALVQQIQEEENIRQLLSVSHLEDNLLQESQRLHEKSSLVPQQRQHQKPLPEDEEITSDDYWESPSPDRAMTMAIPKPAAPVAAAKNNNQEARASASYWNWPTSQEKERLIQIVLEEERARRLTSGSFYETKLLQDAQQQEQESTPALKAAHDSYWVC